VVNVAEATVGPIVEVAGAGAPPATTERAAARVDLARMRNHAVVRYERAVDDAAARRPAAIDRPTLPLATRILVTRLVVDRALVILPLRSRFGG
jgi:hypothetical protein